MASRTCWFNWKRNKSNYQQINNGLVKFKTEPHQLLFTEEKTSFGRLFKIETKLAFA